MSPRSQEILGPLLRRSEVRAALEEFCIERATELHAEASGLVLDEKYGPAQSAAGGAKAIADFMIDLQQKVNQ